jgi:predicted DNA-binding transcriptional regulator AlpA
MFNREQAWLVNPGQSIPPRGERFFRKDIRRDASGRLMVWRENPPRRYSELSKDDILDTDELMRRFKVSRPTLARYMKLRGLKPWRRIGREVFFKKGEVEKWWKQVQSEGKKWPLKVSVKGRR